MSTQSTIPFPEQPATIPIIDIHSYDYYIVAFSAGKDSTAAFLQLLDLGIPPGKIELWHHLIDGEPGTPAFMDWEVTEDYCRKFAAAFNVPIYYSWLEGGFEREMNRDNTAKAKTYFEIDLDGLRVSATSGGDGPLNTRLKFPQVSTDLRVRWCSAYLKIDVARIAINNQERFNRKRTLFISGERAEEGSVDKNGIPKGRAAYAQFEPHECSAKYRHIDRYRPVHQWLEHQVWDIIERYKVQPHPCYYIGFARCSCKFCIFGNENQMRTAWYATPKPFEIIAEYEKQFGVTIKRSESLIELIGRGEIYTAAFENPLYLEAAISTQYKLPIIINNWRLPAGAYGESAGPI